MALNFTTDFTDLGKCFAAFANINGDAGAQTPTGSSKWGSNGAVVKSQATMVDDILTRLSGSGLTSLVPYNNWQTTLASMDTALQSQKTVLQQLSQQIVIVRVNNDVPQQSKTSLIQALQNFILQMQEQGESVKNCTVSSSITAGTNNTGDPLVCCTLTDANGLTLENAFAETITQTCTQDQFNGAVAGSERIAVVGAASVTNPLSYLWPGGSGTSATLTMTDPTQGNGGGQNLLTGSATATNVGAWKAWTGSVPNAWVIDVDGANIADGTSEAYSGSDHCLKFIGNTGGTNLQTALYQNFANGSITGGSNQTLTPNTVYHFTMRVKADVVPAAGVIKVALTDGSGTVINNNAGVANSITVTVSGFGSTDYQNVSGTFQTPTVMPSTARLRIKATTPITSGSNVYMDFGALIEPASQGNNYGGLYPGGPYLSMTRGSVDVIQYVSYTIGDIWTNVIANNYGSSSPTPLSFQTMFNQLFGMASNGLILPSANSPTIANSLIS